MAEPKGAVEVVTELMEKNKYTPTVLGKRIGVKGQYIWDRLHNAKKVKERQSTDLKVSTMAAMLRGMDYKMVAVPADKKVGAEEYELK